MTNIPFNLVGAPTMDFNSFINWTGPGGGVSITYARPNLPLGATSIACDTSDLGQVRLSKALVNLVTVQFSGCNLTGYPSLLPENVTSLNLNANPLLTLLGALPPRLEVFSISDCEQIVSLPMLPATLNTLYADGCALTEDAVNSVLAQLVANGLENGSVNLGNGTNAAPAGQGIVDAMTLVSRGWSVTTN